MIVRTYRTCMETLISPISEVNNMILNTKRETLDHLNALENMFVFRVEVVSDGPSLTQPFLFYCFSRAGSYWRKGYQ